MSNHIFASNKNWNKKVFLDLQKNSKEKWFWSSNPTELKKNIKEQQPRYIFFIHWGWKVEKEIYSKYECVCFHMTDLPFGRGGSPLQNLIMLGLNKTKLSAFKMNDKMDAGPIYIKKNLSLKGRAQNIYVRVGKMSKDIILWIINEEPKPINQLGKPLVFKRRKKEQSIVTKQSTLIELYDFIRMLDAETYPRANIEFGNFKIEFFKPKLQNDNISANVIIKKIEN